MQIISEAILRNIDNDIAKLAKLNSLLTTHTRQHEDDGDILYYSA